MASRIESALEAVENLRGWRAFFSLPPEVADADAIVGALPWAEGGVARPGTEVRLITDGHGRLVVITGGALSNEEGALLFDIQDKLRDVLVSAYIVPPQSADPELITRMYLSGLAPRMPTKKLPNPQAYSVSATGLFILLSVVRHMGIVTLIVLILCLVCAAIAWRKRTELNDILADPDYVVSVRWATALPQLARH